MNHLFDYTVPLSTPVKAAVLDMGEDYTKVQAKYGHWAVRGLKDIVRRVLRWGYERGVFTVHASLKTVPIPLGCRRIAYVGILDECGNKHPLRHKENIVGQIEEPICIETCPQCNQGKDICENLQITEDEAIIEITDSTGTHSYTNLTTKYFENGVYYVVKNWWILNTTTNLAEEFTTKTFLTDFDMLSCGCIAPTEPNISKIKEHCYDCYCACYTPCREDSNDIGGYRVLEEYVQFDRNIPYDKIYMEWETAVPKKNGVYHIPEVASECLTAYIKFRASRNNKSFSSTDKEMFKDDYEDELAKCDREIGRMPLSLLVDSLTKNPKIS